MDGLSAFTFRNYQINKTMAKEKFLLLIAVPKIWLLSSQNREREYQQMKFDHAAKGIANPMEPRELRRRDIARIHTEVRNRELAEMSPDQLEMRSKIRARRRRQK